MAFSDRLPADEAAVVELAAQLRDSGNLHPLIARPREGEIGPERARDALRVLAELDLDLLLQIALDSLISQYVEDPGLAYQPRRVVRGDGPAARRANAPRAGGESSLPGSSQPPFLALGVPTRPRDPLGHTDAGFTMTTYVHLFDARKQGQAAREQLDADSRCG